MKYTHKLIVNQRLLRDGELISSSSEQYSAATSVSEAKRIITAWNKSVREFCPSIRRNKFNDFFQSTSADGRVVFQTFMTIERF